MLEGQRKIRVFRAGEHQTVAARTRVGSGAAQQAGAGCGGRSRRFSRRSGVYGSKASPRSIPRGGFQTASCAASSLNAAAKSRKYLREAFAQLKPIE